MSEHKDWQADILQYIDQLSDLSDFLLFEVAYREITIVNINGWIEELRDILWEMRNLQDDPDIGMPVIPYAAIRKVFCEIVKWLCYASDILELEDHSLEYKPKLYQLFMDCSVLLDNIVDICLSLLQKIQ